MSKGSFFDKIRILPFFDIFVFTKVI